MPITIHTGVRSVLFANLTSAKIVHYSQVMKLVSKPISISLVKILLKIMTNYSRTHTKTRKISVVPVASTLLAAMICGVRALPPGIIMVASRMRALAMVEMAKKMIIMKMIQNLRGQNSCSK